MIKIKLYTVILVMCSTTIFSQMKKINVKEIDSLEIKIDEYREDGKVFRFFVEERRELGENDTIVFKYELFYEISYKYKIDTSKRYVDMNNEFSKIDYLKYNEDTQTIKGKRGDLYFWIYNFEDGLYTIFKGRKKKKK